MMAYWKLKCVHVAGFYAIKIEVVFDTYNRCFYYFNGEINVLPRYNNQLALMRRDLRNCKGKIAEQQKQILEYASRFDEADKKNEETSRKFSTLLQVSIDS